MVTLTERERMLRTYKRMEIDRIMMLDSPWAGTLRRWKNEGLPENTAWQDYFGFDRIVRVCPDNSPRFERRVIEENERYRIVTTAWGGTVKAFKELDSTPETLNFYYSDPKKWEEAKKAMYTYHENRIPWKYLEENYPKWKAEGRFLQLVVWFGFDVAHSRLTGTENMLIAMYDDPEWVEDIFDTIIESAGEI